jgi:hypothetical protein
MRSLVAGAVVAVAVLGFAPPALSQARPPARKAAKAAHPDVGRDQDCQGCHAGATPASFEAWRQGKHGLDLVTCVVCHGSTGADFTRRPAADRCTGCHSAQTATLAAPFMKGKDCFTCHPGHALDPHAVAATASTAARLDADAELRRELQRSGPVNGPNPAADAAAKPPPPAAPAAAPPAAPGKEKDLAGAQPHPPTEKP